MGLGLAVVLLLCISAVFGDSHGGGGDDYMVDMEDQEKHVNRFCRPELQSCFPTQLEWAKLDDDLDGTLAWPDVSFGYTGYNYQYNLRTFTFPLVHAVCHTEEDIQHAVKFAKKHKLRVTIKSSGHELWGRSSAHGSFSINLMKMKKITINPQATARSPAGEVTVQTGVNFGELYTQVEAHGRTVVGGSGAKVSPGGYIAGGGHSPLSPQFGLGVDSVLEIRVVLADGRVATCTENKTVITNDDGTTETRHNDHLFWALRGGGGGTFAVVVEYVLKLHPAPASFVSAYISTTVYNNDSNIKIGEKFLDTYFNWTKTASSDWSGYIYLNNMQKSGVVNINNQNVTYHNTGMIRGFLIKYSPWNGNEEAELKQFYALRDSYTDRMTIGLSNHTKLWGDYLSVDPMYGPYTREYTLGGLITAEKHDANLRDFFVDELLDGNNGQLHCYFVRLGGKVMDFDEKSSAVHPGFRKARSSVVCSMAAVGEGTRAFVEQDRLKQKASELQNKLHHFSVGDYINEGYAPNPDWKLAFWGPGYVKLLMVKIRYDPDNMFWCYHCVGSDREDWDYGEYKISKSSNLAMGFSTVLFLLFTAVLM